MTIKAPVRKPWLERQEQEAHIASGLNWFFFFFFVSGFCSILYELIWLRLAMAQFGVTTATTSIVLSCFMAGLGVGSWAAGYISREYNIHSRRQPLHLYATAEVLIACGALVVPLMLSLGRALLARLGDSSPLSSMGWYIAAGLWLAITLVPWCACIGATIPLGMLAIRRSVPSESRRSFSFLYLANVLGAVFGALLPLLVIELRGFTTTLQVGMVLNLGIAAAALRLTRKQNWRTCSDATTSHIDREAVVRDLGRAVQSRSIWLLFLTGLTSMGMEVVWIRQYTIFVGTFVYSFATILGIYLAATFAGSQIYRVWSRRRDHEAALVWMFVWLAALMPLVTADERLSIPSWLRVPLGISGFSALLGFLTPMLVDRFSTGDPHRAGVGYGVNVAGCILGPLVAGFILLPLLGERYSLVVLALPWLAVGSASVLSARPELPRRHGLALTASCLIVALSLALVVMSRSYVEQTPGAQVRRDSTATVVAAGEGMRKRLLVNGISMTYLTPVTKMMSALPLTFLPRAAKDALVICFGMGTTHRSMLSWGIDSTAVELVPSVPALFSYFHSDAPELIALPQSHIVVDDGRRYLERTAKKYDVIVVDPPPPIGAAGSSLLYSREFYATALKRLSPDGILQQWYPGGDAATTAAVARALKESFPYVRAFGSVDGWGIHYLASRESIPDLSASELAKRLPPDAEADLLEWGPFSTAEQQFAAVLGKEIPIDGLVGLKPHVPAVQDDRPINEYYLMRAHGWMP
jgi:predicted membrane-bound spermidine synthase